MKKKSEHICVPIVKKRIELIDRIFSQLDDGYVDLNNLDDPEEIELIRRVLTKHRASLIKKWL